MSSSFNNWFSAPNSATFQDNAPKMPVPVDLITDQTSGMLTLQLDGWFMPVNTDKIPRDDEGKALYVAAPVGDDEYSVGSAAAPVGVDDQDHSEAADSFPDPCSEGPFEQMCADVDSLLSSSQFNDDTELNSVHQFASFGHCRRHVKCASDCPDRLQCDAYCLSQLRQQESNFRSRFDALLQLQQSMLKAQQAQVSLVFMYFT